jgi:hypothetical protein
MINDAPMDVICLNAKHRPSLILHLRFIWPCTIAPLPPLLHHCNTLPVSPACPSDLSSPPPSTCLPFPSSPSLPAVSPILKKIGLNSKAGAHLLSALFLCYNSLSQRAACQKAPPSQRPLSASARASRGWVPRRRCISRRMQ